MKLTHLGGPTVLVETQGWRILTDPTFDPAGGRYGFGWGTGSTKTTGPALSATEVGEIDAVVLSHDQHADNLDDSAREWLGQASRIITTTTAARRLPHPLATGLSPGQATLLKAPDRPAVRILATPCRHGPPLSRPITGPVVGFALTVGSTERTSLRVTGDTVLTGAVRDTARALRPDVLVMHLGGVRFPITGPLRYTVNADDAVELVHLAQPRVAVPVHAEGWTHFAEPLADLRRTLDHAPDDVRAVVRWLRPGEPATV